MTEPYIVAALYQFAPLENLKAMQAHLQDICDKNDICGTLLLAHEGINGTIAGSREGIDALKAALLSYPALDNLEYKESFADRQPFHRTKVRIKKEIVTIGIDTVDPCKTVGTYLSPEEWNAVISDPDTIVIDTRNDYEIDIGTFKNSVNPKTETFREFPAWVEKHLHNQKHKKVAMFCTGGIRCEKASSYMKQAGFEEVYHLKGGILKYLEDTPPAKSLWDGACFVFDQRVAVSHGLALTDYTLCASCRCPVSAEDRKSAKYTEGVCCPACANTITDDRKTRSAERQKQVLLAEARGEKHIGKKTGSRKN
ncbi:MAG: rhodanese-related sulfurtransferase [Alphaproteobacteria bacterium]|nr:rhodanese-related sulfurtransferase [Alphaproteobacteria bacterium]